MPADNRLNGYLLKKEACERFNRSLRQLARDFDKAELRGDREFTRNFRMRLEDGTVLEADETSKDQIQEFRDKGLNPTWFVRESWMAETYGRRDASNRTDVDEPEQVPTPQHQPEPPAAATPADGMDVVAAKDELISVLREENRFLRDSLDQERQRSTDDRELTKQLHVLLKNLQDRALPAPGRGMTSLATPAVPRTTASEPAVDVDVDDEADVVEVPVPNHKPKPSLAKKRSDTKSKGESADARTTTRPRWYEMPTLKRFLNR